MKIVHISPSFWPQGGGVETHVAEVAREQLRNGDEVAVITQTHDGIAYLPLSLDALTKKAKVTHRQRYPLLSKSMTWRAIWSQRQHLASADLIIIHDVFWWVWPVWPEIHNQVITTFHGWEGEYPIRWQSKLQRYINARFSKATLHVGGWIQKYYWDTPDQVIYGGCRVSIQKNVSPPKDLHAVFIGRLEPENDIQLYLQLVKKLRDAYPDFSVTWVGSGSLAAECDQLGEVVGWVSDVTPYILESQFVFASSYLSMLQAQALGRVVVGLASHQLKYDYLTTFPNANAMIIAKESNLAYQQISSVLNTKKKYVEMSKKARMQAEKMTWSAVAKIYQKLYDQHIAPTQYE